MNTTISVPSNSPINFDDSASEAVQSECLSNDNDNDDNNNRSSTPALAQKETRLVTRLRLLFMVILVASGSAITAVTYKYTSKAEKENFRVRFTDFARQVTEVSQINARNILSQFETMGLHMTTYAVGTGSSWPFVTIPQFEAISQNVIKQTGALHISLTPLVTEEQLFEYEFYAVANQGWVAEGYEFAGVEVDEVPSISPKVFHYDYTNGASQVFGRVDEKFYAPISQLAPVSAYEDYVNFDVFGEHFFGKLYSTMKVTGRSAVTGLAFKATNPGCFFSAPVFTSAKKSSDVVGAISGLLEIRSFFESLLPEGIDGMIIVLRHFCDGELGDTISYEVNGPTVVYLGPQDFHDPKYSSYEHIVDLELFRTAFGCKYTASIFPSEDFESQYVTNNPIYYTIAVAFIFTLTVLAFIVFNLVVERRQATVVTTATRSNAIVDSLFPSNVRDRLMEEAGGDSNTKKNKTRDFASFASMIDQAMLVQPDEAGDITGQPIADLFPNVTVMFADIAGFTLWSSTRSPTEVFKLLEAVYAAFDRTAKRLRVFKVETIGDCYVAVAGLPESRKDHAIVMCRFARECTVKMNQLLPQLEFTLGQGTLSLCMRFGLHSGEVTAGVLRGEKSRFQLFGDTVNTASRMESTGEKNRIQVSQATADLLIAGGKGQWIQPREGLVTAKGKGNMQTYWVKFSSGSTVASEQALASSILMKPLITADAESLSGGKNTASSFLDSPIRSSAEEKHKFRIDWNVSVLSTLIGKIVAARGTNDTKVPSEPFTVSSSNSKMDLDEVKDVISSPSSSVRAPETVSLPTSVVDQLQDYVTTIASLYNRENAFHSFDHASQVVMSALNMVSLINTEPNGFPHRFVSDSLTQFSVAFAALIHDVDHAGLPNAQLILENKVLAERYKNKSVAEQNSMDVAWVLLMQPKYKELRDSIYTDQAEHDRFRQLVVNCVMATDIMDKDLGSVRDNRWREAFSDVESPMGDGINHKVTAFIEHLIQASDVSHTMQRWNVYIKWNERLFCEMYQAYKSGRSNKDPSEDWYQSEIGFFDYYVIPLARKLKECGAFGAALDEYINYAIVNRTKWELQGRDVVSGYLAKCAE